MPDKIVLSSGSAVWNPERQCWEFVEIYWQPDFPPLDDEWLDRECFVRRTEQVMWREVSCRTRGDDGIWTEQARERTSIQSFILAEHWCERGASQQSAWIEPTRIEHPRADYWDLDGEFWRSTPDDGGGD